MGRAYSNDLGDRVVQAVEKVGMSSSAAARRYGVARSTAMLWIQRYRETGDVSASPMGRPKGMKVAAFQDFIMAKMKNKDTTLDILQNALWEECGVYASRTLLHRFIQAEGLSYKKNRARQRTEPT